LRPNRYLPPWRYLRCDCLMVAIIKETGVQSAAKCFRNVHLGMKFL